ncbi:MAG TPA: hypothetical protein VFA70_04565 [Dehalococcoidia bacterium]|nr:hypothetical protein [Dehalococcoidia bacterium]
MSERNGRAAASALGVARAELAEADAQGRMREVYERMRAVLRVPFVDQLWRVLALHPDFLAPAWEWLEPVLGSVEVERAADDLRRGAVITLALSLPSHKAFRGDMSRWEIGADDRERISNYTMAEHYVLPKLLLAAELLYTELRPDADRPPLRGLQAEQLPRGVAEGMPPVGPMRPEEARGEIAELFAEIRRRHGYDAIADYYRTIARAGDFLRIAWNPLRPLVGDPEFVSQSRRVGQRAAQLCLTLRQFTPGELELPRDAAGRDVIAALTFYRNRLLPETLVEVTVVKGLTDGPAAAAYNRYSLTDTPPPEAALQ